MCAEKIYTYVGNKWQVLLDFKYLLQHHELYHAML